MADAAVAEPSAPSGAPPPAPPPSGAEPQSGAPNGAPQAGSEQAGAEPATPPPVPYLTFKAERSRLQGQMRDVQRQLAEAQQYRDHYGTLQQQHAELAERYNNFNALANVIRQNPEIAQQIEEALGQDTARGPVSYTHLTLPTN